MYDVRRYANEVQCKGCYDVIWKEDELTYYIKGYCRKCRRTVPKHILPKQYWRFLERRTKKKYG
jgi:hypothetical protein